MEKFTAVFERDGGWWVGYVEEIPGAHSQERTLEDARESLREVVQLMIETNRERLKEHLGDAETLREELLVHVG